MYCMHTYMYVPEVCQYALFWEETVIIIRKALREGRPPPKAQYLLMAYEFNDKKL